MIQIENLSQRYPGAATSAVSNVSLSVERSECLVLVGGSGSGKTTLLKCINRLIEASEGRVFLDGRDTRDWTPFELRRRVGYAFQQIGLFPHFTVAENVGITPSLLGWSESRIAARVEALLELVELPVREYGLRRPAELSGGQQQRVGLARALAASPDVLLLDEPFGALDPLTRERLQESFRRIRSELETTVLFVTHDMTEALLLGDRIAVLAEGELLQVASPRDLLSEPADPRVAELLEAPKRQREALSQWFLTTDGSEDRRG
jgi:osmoprotectant transport system ATP-binding protein